MIILPDIHGRDFWQEPADKALKTGEHIVFLGDYLDPYQYEGIYPSVAFNGFVKIVELKIAHPTDITLLLGNHDLHYIDEGIAGGRKDYDMAIRIRRIIKDYSGIFNMSYTCEAGGRHFLLTHAGVKQGWLLYNKELFEGVGPDEIANCLNAMWHNKDKRPQLLRALAQVSYSRWGRYAYGSPVWNDIDDMDDSLEELPGWFQIFGHSQQETDPVIGEHFACIDCRRAFRLNETTGKIEDL